MGDRRAQRSAEAEDLKRPSGYELIPDKDLMQMPPLLRSNARSLATDRLTDATDRVDIIVIIACLLLSQEHQTHPGKGGFFRSLRAHRQAPSPPSLCSLPNR